MEKFAAARSNKLSTPPSVTSGSGTSRTDESAGSDRLAARQRNQFLAMLLNMSWQLAVVVLVPVIGGVFIDKAMSSSPVFLVVGLILALGGTVLVLWRTMRTASQLPVPKLSDAERRAIAKSYEEDDSE